MWSDRAALAGGWGFRQRREVDEPGALQVLVMAADEGRGSRGEVAHQRVAGAGTNLGDDRQDLAVCCPQQVDRDPVVVGTTLRRDLGHPALLLLARLAG